MDRILEPPLDEALKPHAPAAHYAAMRNDRIVARCSIWAESTPTYENQPVGLIGHYAAEDEAAGVSVLRHAVEQLNQRGRTTIVGPMDGSTWRRYRLVTERGAEPPFFLEPDNPDDWSAHFAAAGFSPLAHYVSALNDNLAIVDPRHDTAMTRLADAGVRIRPLDVSRFEQELTAVHELSLSAFAHNFLYTPIARTEFLAMYAPLRAHVRPELILLAEEGDTLVGFMFGLPDVAQANRGEPVTTAIAKTLAVRPDRTGLGLGSVLTSQFQQVARAKGFTRVIHALMHAGNRSLSISSRFGHPFRRYTLYAASLRSGT